MHYTGWQYKYDEWIELPSPRVQKQWARGQPVRLNTRLDVVDQKGKWLEAQVIEISNNNNDESMRVHFKGFASKWDELVPIGDEYIGKKYAEVGLHSNANGFAKFHGYVFK